MAKAKPRTLDIEITQEDIDAAHHRYQQWLVGTEDFPRRPRCLVEVALDRQLPGSGSTAGVMAVAVWQNPTGEHLPQRYFYRGVGPEYTTLICDFDRGGRVEPTILHMEEVK